MRRRGKHILIMVAWLGAFILLGLSVWNFQAGHLFVFLFLAASMAAYIYALFASCPECGKLIMARPVKLFGLDVYLWMLLTPERCRHCGKLL